MTIDLKFNHTLNPRYCETDQGGRIHHASLVPWLEEARVAYLEHVGIHYQDVEAEGFVLVVRGLEIRYKAALQFGAPVRVNTQVSKLGKASVDFMYELFQNEKLCATATTELACVGRDGRPVALPQNLAKQLA